MKEKKTKNKKLQLPDMNFGAELILKNIDEVIYYVTLDAKGNKEIVFLSDKIKNILGLTKQKYLALGKKILALCHPEDIQEITKKTTQTLKKKIKNTFRYRFLNPQKNKYIWIEETIYPQVDKKKKLIGYFGVSRDISEQKQKEQELDNNKTQLSNLLSNLPGIAYRCLNDKNWTMKFISSGCLSLTGYKPEEFIDNNKRSFASIIHPEDRNIGRKEIKEALRKKKSFEIEYRIIHKSGEIKWIWEKGSGVYNEKNKLIYIEGFVNDIAARKKAELEVNQKWLNYQNLVDSMPNGIFIHVNGKILFGNKAAYDIIEIERGTNPDKISLIDFIAPEDRPLAFARIKKVMLGKEVPFTDYRAVSAKGTHKDIRVKGMPIIFNSVHAVQIVIQDVTLEKKLEEERVRIKITEQTNRELQKEINLRVLSEQKLKAIFESTTHLIWTLNKNREIISYNTQYAEAVKILCGATLVPGTKTSQFKWAFSEEDYKILYDAQTTAFNGTDKKIEIKLNAIDGKEYFREMHFHPININGKINEIAAVAQDTTERRKYEKQIIEQSARLKAIFESGSQLMWTVNNKIFLTSFNKNYSNTIYELYGIYPKLNTTPGKFENKTDSEEYHKFWDGKYEDVFNGKSVEFYTERTAVSGKKTHRHIFLHPIYNEKNEVIEVSGLGYDISEQKKIEEEMSKSLKEKEVLLKEVHHRVKNNLQVISSILNLQTAYIKDKETINILKECQNRIKTMSFIHESLYQNKDFSQINFSEYLVTLVKNLFYSFETNQQKTRANFDIDEILLNLDISIPCGLIVNELVSNALKYAFSEGDEGVIFIQLKKTGDKIKIVISDNGKGMPEHINYKNTETLGLQLVSTLAEQINGNIRMERNKGTIFEIIF